MKIFSPQKEYPLPKGFFFPDASCEADMELVGPLAEDALKKGLNVVWPIGARTSVEALEKLVDEYPGKIIPYAPLLSTPRVLGLKRLLESGRLGGIGIVTHQRFCGSVNSVGFKNLNALDLALNDVAIIRRFFGRASQVMGTRAELTAGGKHQKTDFLTACLAFRSGMIANVVCHVRNCGESRFLFDYAGQKGNALHESNEEMLYTENQCYSPDERKGAETAWRGIIACVENGSAPPYTVHEWLDDLSMIHTIAASAENFCPLTPEPRRVPEVH